MPSISIDTFFACTLMVSVVIMTTVSITGTMMSHIKNWKDMNEESYLKSIADNILSSKGFPTDWGSNSNVKPEELGLAESSFTRTIELDSDKVSRLNPDNYVSLSYTDILTAARLTDIATRISISQIMQIAISLSSSTSQGNSTSYTFKVAVNQDSGPVTALLHWYAVGKNFLQHHYSNTSTAGLGCVNVQIPNESNGTVALIVFARAAQDPMMTAYAVQLFSHPSQELLQDNTFLDLSPLNYTLHLGLKSANTTIESIYAFSYGYQATLTEISNTSPTIPRMLDSSPTVLIVTGLNHHTDFFVEWTAYPQVPFKTGSDFTNSESHTFSYVVIIKDTLYKMILNFGDVNP